MRTLSRRLRKLEDLYQIGPETEFDRRLRERIEAGRRRLAELEAREQGPAPCHTEPDRDLTGQPTPL